MSIKSWAAAVGLCATILVAPQASASDHNDGAVVKQDPSTDIADLYAWMSPGAAGPNRMYMIMTVNPAAQSQIGQVTGIKRQGMNSAFS